MACLVEGMGSIVYPTHTQKDCVDGDLSTLKTVYTVHYVVALRPLAGHQVLHLQAFNFYELNVVCAFWLSGVCKQAAGNLRKWKDLVRR
eukprot:1161401-Pelagomonas_calceolata.AAC.28